jgi:hypothetical protein
VVLAMDKLFIERDAVLFQGRAEILKMYQEKYHDISEGQSTPTPDNPLICPPSI